MILKRSKTRNNNQKKYQQIRQELRLIARHKTIVAGGIYTIYTADNRLYIWHRKLNKPIAYTTAVGKGRVVKCRGGTQLYNELKAAFNIPVIRSNKKNLTSPEAMAPPSEFKQVAYNHEMKPEQNIQNGPVSSFTNIGLINSTINLNPETFTNYPIGTLTIDEVATP